MAASARHEEPLPCPAIPCSPSHWLRCRPPCPCAPPADYIWNWYNLNSPDWDISVTDFGYSDYLLDHTPGFEGREYLSGEWGGAIGYRQGVQTVSPIWLEPRFSFPDWDTNSNFVVLQGMHDVGPTAQGLPSARSVVGNGVIELTQDLKFIDTVTGVAMGLVGASLGGEGASLLSNRYVLQQTYTFRNVSGGTLDNVQFFQLLHGLTSQQGAYDDRDHGGVMRGYRHDLTLFGDAQSAGGQYDYVAFHSAQAPSAVEVGRFGIEGIDDHFSAKPSVGTHLSVEQNALNGIDSFAPELRWVAGAQRYDLGTLNHGESVTFDTLLTIRTGWQVDDSSDSGSVNGGSYVPGGIDYEFLGDHSTGQFFVEYEPEDWEGVVELIDLGEIGPLTFRMPGSHLQLYEIEFDGSFDGLLRLTFGFDPTLIAPGMNLETLRIYHWTGDAWEDLEGEVDAANYHITVLTETLSPFALGAPVPEPGTWFMLTLGLLAVATRVPRCRSAGRSAER